MRHLGKCRLSCEHSRVCLTIDSDTCQHGRHIHNNNLVVRSGNIGSAVGVLIAHRLLMTLKDVKYICHRMWAWVQIISTAVFASFRTLLQKLCVNMLSIIGRGRGCGAAVVCKYQTPSYQASHYSRHSDCRFTF